MKKIFFLITFLLIFSCSNNKMVYWCGDHACVNKSERQAYFKKYMVLEMREVVKNKIDNKEQKASKKKFKDEKKEGIKEEKRLKKLAKLENKRKKKEEKKLKKEIIKEEKVSLKKKKKLINDNNIDQPKIVQAGKKKINLLNKKNKFSEFDEIAKIIKNNSKSAAYPNINTVPD